MIDFPIVVDGSLIDGYFTPKISNRIHIQYIYIYTHIIIDNTICHYACVYIYIPSDSCIQNFGRIPNLQKNQAQVHKNGAM